MPLIPPPRGVIDERGHTYSLLKVREYAGLLDCKAAWLCDCECGRTAVVRGDRLRTGHTVSCGCWRESSEIRQAARMQTPAKRRREIAAAGARLP